MFLTCISRWHEDAFGTLAVVGGTGFSRQHMAGAIRRALADGA